MNDFKVSVIIPIFNAVNFIEKAVHSALMQKEVGEVILIEDGSTDGSWEKCLTIKETLDKVKLFFHENNANKGVSASRNLGIKNAINEYISFLDADDYYLENRFRKAKELFQSLPEVHGVYECVESFFENRDTEIEFTERGYSIRLMVNDYNINSEHLFEYLVCKSNYGYISIIGLTIKRETISAYNFDENLTHKEDTKLIWQLAKNSNLVCGNIEPFIFRRVHNNNAILKSEKIIQTSKMQFYKYWFDEIFRNKFSKNVNRKLIKMYVSTLCNQNGKTGKINLFIGLIVLLIRNPRTILKWIV